MDLSKINTGGVVVEKDTLGGGGYGPVESGAHMLSIETIRRRDGEGKAVYIDITGKIDGNIYRESLMLTNKDGQAFNEYGETKRLKPSFVQADNIIKILTGGEFGITDVNDWFEEKVIKLYDFDLKAEVDTDVLLLSDEDGVVIGGDILVGILKYRENKRIRDSEGVWQSTADERFTNRINAVFDPETKQTPLEIEADNDATFYDKWVEKNSDTVVDRYKAVSGGASRGSSVGAASRGALGGGRSRGAAGRRPTRR